jgi:hypothetical protein
MDKHEQSIAGVLNCFDRIILKGHLPISWPEGMESFLRRESVLIKDFKSYVTRISKRVIDHAQQVAAAAERPYRHIGGKMDKEAEARRLAQADQITEGLICVFTRVEQAQSFKLKFGKGRPCLVSNQPKCLCVYFYMMDRVFGLIHFRLQTWFPFTAQVYVNGHEWLARQMKTKGLIFEQAENAFVALSDVAKANRLANNFAGLDWSRVLDRWATQVNPLFKDLLRGMRYRWCLEQAEYATDILMKTPNVLRGLYPALVEHATLRWAASDILGFLGRKYDGRFNGDCRTEVKCRLNGVRVKHWINGNAIKMYNKHPLLLRIETVINRPYEFKVRRFGCRNGRRVIDWFSMSKRVRYFPRYAEVSLQANSRYLQGLAVVTDLSSHIHEIDSICEPVVREQHRSRGLNPLSKREIALFAAVLHGEHTLHGFKLRDIVRVAGIHLPTEPMACRRLTSKIYHRFAMLRAHGLIAKVPRSRRWRVTFKGHAFMSAALKVKTHDLPIQMHDLAA